MNATTFEEYWEKFNTLHPLEDEDPNADKWIFKAGYEAGYEAAKKEPPRVVSFLED